MDKITHIAFILYHSSEDPDVRSNAIDLLNGETSLHALKKNLALLHLVNTAETMAKKQPSDKEELQRFVEEHLLVEA
ncbi:hypothetical protein A8F94_01600 [Bacillus sp. FJAT-27225]|uniref:hypothetical protein n=1 Tax=Bacillus sp. FJAT-27225 TaxID=1743144 RepID=UPI00080C2C45|nr:hypothetical protein [Bacillus sp. FJAT-27225]OCA90602.1 hypothetical protein A8F94_01600 [Bacillus sp. FJAT-27225]